MIYTFFLLLRHDQLIRQEFLTIRKKVLRLSEEEHVTIKRELGKITQPSPMIYLLSLAMNYVIFPPIVVSIPYLGYEGLGVGGGG